MSDLKIMRSDLIKKIIKKSKVSSFLESVSFGNHLKRELTITEIDEDTGIIVENIIRYWNAVDEELDIPVEKRDPIKIFLDSPGGSLFATLTIVDVIKMSKTPVYTINIGQAYSGGFIIFLVGYKRFAYPHSTFLFHEGSTGGGNAQDAGKFANYAAFYNTVLQKLKDIVLTHMNVDEQWYAEHKKDDVWLTVEEAAELGVYDEVCDSFIL